MFFEELSLVNFRNFSSFNCQFQKKITLIKARNGKGKTNLLESIALLSFPKSFRTTKEESLISIGKESTKVKGKVKDDQEEKKTLEYSLNLEKELRWKKTLKINEIKKKTVDFIEAFFCVLFSPEDINLINGEPRERRRFLDFLIGTLDVSYFRNLTSFYRVLGNRNRLLKKGRSFGGISPKESFYWNKELVRFGSHVLYSRFLFFKLLNRYLKSFSPLLERMGDSLKIVYFPDPSAIKKRDSLEEISFILEEKIKECRSREIEAGFSLFGPQRDDWKVFLLDSSGEKDLSLFGSRAQKRLAILVLKLSYWKLIREKKNIAPVFLFDDPFSELDDLHSQLLSEVIKGFQAIITTCTLDNVPKEIIDQAELINL